LIKIYDDLVGTEYVKQIQETMLNPSFPWYYAPTTVPEKDNVPWFFHNFVEEGTGKFVSPYMNIPMNLMDLFMAGTGNKIDKIFRIRANLTFPIVYQQEFSGRHVDQEFPHYVILYYVNDSDGETIVINNHHNIIPAKAGRFVLFDGNIEHCTRLVKESPHRIVFNFNVTLT
jgi:hypothetical protein